MMDKGATVMKAYRFKISFINSKIPIWRKVEVPASMTFDSFSNLIKHLFFRAGGYDSFVFRFPKEDVPMKDSYSRAPGNYSVSIKEYQLGQLEKYSRFTMQYAPESDRQWEFSIVREAILESSELLWPVLARSKGPILVDCLPFDEYISMMTDENGKISKLTLLKPAEINPALKADYVCDDTVPSPLPADYSFKDAVEHHDIYYFSGEEDDDEDFELINTLAQYNSHRIRQPLPESEDELEALCSLSEVQGMEYALSRIARKFRIPFSDLVETLELSEAQNILFHMFFSGRIREEENDDDYDDEDDDYD